MKSQKFEISINIIYGAPGKIDGESIYDIVTRDQVIKDIQEEIKRRIEENISEWDRCTPIIAHKFHKD